MIHRILSWLNEFVRPQPAEVLTSSTVSTSRKRGRPKQSKSAVTKTVRKKKTK
jgi:hypothetical protein